MSDRFPLTLSPRIPSLKPGIWSLALLAAVLSTAPAPFRQAWLWPPPVHSNTHDTGGMVSQSASPIIVPADLTPSTASLSGGQTCSFTVTLNGTASSNTTLAISVDQTGAFTNLPGSVVVPAGYRSATFSAQAATVTSSVTATVTTTVNYSSASASVTISP